MHELLISYCLFDSQKLIIYLCISNVFLASTNTVLPAVSARFYQQSDIAPSRRTGQQVALDEHGKMDLKDQGLFSNRHKPVMESNTVPHVRKGPVPSDRFYMHRELASGQAGPSNEVFRKQVRNDVEFDEDASGFVED